MIRSLITGALALACACIAACASTPAAPSAASIAAMRLSAETSYDASLIGLEQSAKAGELTGQAATDARTALLASYAALVAGRAGLSAAAAADPALLAAQAQVDRDYARIIAELPPS